MCKEMQFAINRQVVIDGLNRRAEERAAAEREAALESFEDSMIRRCNAHCEETHLQNRMDEEVRTAQNRSASNISGRAKAKASRQNRQKDTALGCLAFFAYAVLLLWLTTWTYLPIWGATGYILGGAVFLVLYLGKMYGRDPQEVSC